MSALQDKKDFEEAGFNAKQAEALAFKIHENIAKNTATKAELENARLKIEGKLENVRLKIEGKIDRDISSLKITMLIWIGALVAFIIGYLEFLFNRG